MGYLLEPEDPPVEPEDEPEEVEDGVEEVEAGALEAAGVLAAPPESDLLSDFLPFELPEDSPEEVEASFDFELE